MAFATSSFERFMVSMLKLRKMQKTMVETKEVALQSLFFENHDRADAPRHFTAVIRN